MFSIIFDKFFIFSSLFLVSLAIASDDLKDDNIDRGSRSDKGGLWFGPRLGKRSFTYSSDIDRQTAINLLKAAEAVRFYYDQMQNDNSLGDDELPTYVKAKKKVIFTPRPGRGLNEQKKVIFRPILGRDLDEEKGMQSVDFTPRLGRRLSDDMPATPSDYDTYRADSEQVDSRSKYSPRLGRMMNFSPRLGRDMNFSPRLGREMTFSPRLGREMTFSPRLGREIDVGFMLVLTAVLSKGDIILVEEEDEEVTRRTHPRPRPRIFPRKLQQQLVKLMSISEDKAPLKARRIEEAEDQEDYVISPTYYDHLQVRGAQDKDVVYQEYEESSAPGDQPVMRVNDNPLPRPRKVQPIPVNLNQLVEKVKVRLLEQLTASEKASLFNSNDNGQLRDIIRPPRRQPVADYRDHEADPLLARRPRQYSTRGQAAAYLTEPTREPASQLIESEKFYNKVRLSKPKNQKDSYEEYEKRVPKQSHDIFATEEDIPQRNVQKEYRYGRPVDTQINQQLGKRLTFKKRTPNHPRYTTRSIYTNDNNYDDTKFNNKYSNDNNNEYRNDNNYDIRNDNFNGNKNDFSNNKDNKYNDNLANRDTKFNNNDEDKNNNDFKTNNANKYNNNLANRDNKDQINNVNKNIAGMNRKTTIKSDYPPARQNSNRNIVPGTGKGLSVTSTVDNLDAMNHDGITTEHDNRAMTEFIDSDYRNVPTDRKTTKEKRTQYPFKKKSPSRIATNMLTRERYSQQTPNYYEKLPRIAEKYNFEEPLPQRDRVREVMRKLPMVPSNINGKVKA